MDTLFYEGQVPIKSWCADIEEGTMEQAHHLASLPFAFKHVCLMPDAHQGYGMPIGGVLATDGVVVPNAVGVDIGCGVRAVRTSLQDISMPQLEEVLGFIREAIPVGFEKCKDKIPAYMMPECVPGDIASREYENARLSLGTLGGGNHFIEIQKDEEGHVWVMIHSGSRNLGKQVADHYNKLAVQLNRKYHSTVPAEWELAFLPTDSVEGRNYLEEMWYCVEFAKQNRQCMLYKVQDIMQQVCGPFDYIGTYDVAHNYAYMGHHYGKDVMVHRKGATAAYEDQIGIIPGSQGSSSYIVKGLGNRESFMSCSHGAGRKMGRKQAIRTLDYAKEVKHLKDMGVLHSVRNETNLDEAPGAYKDIEQVMTAQADLVVPIHKLTPIAVIKG